MDEFIHVKRVQDGRVRVKSAGAPRAAGGWGTEGRGGLRGRGRVAAGVVGFPEGKAPRERSTVCKLLEPGDERRKGCDGRNRVSLRGTIILHQGEEEMCQSEVRATCPEVGEVVCAEDRKACLK